jgi:hypothetical protein
MDTWHTSPFIALLKEHLVPRLNLGLETTWMDDVSKQ